MNIYTFAFMPDYNKISSELGEEIVSPKRYGGINYFGILIRLY